jgi:hypothetical protein
VDIGLPRPRSLVELESTPEFNAYKKQILELVREEARKSFAGSEKD